MQISRTSAHDWGLSWIAAEPAYMQRASYALATDGGVWLVDPVDGDGLGDLIAPLGDVRGVLQLLDRHPRDGAALAARYGVPLLRVPFTGIPGTPFSVIRVANRPWWREAALWWPRHRALIGPEALGTVGYFCAPGAALGVHPLLRVVPPRMLGGLDPFHLLPGHGEPLSGDDVAGAIEETLRRSRRDIPRVLKAMAARRATRDGDG